MKNNKIEQTLCCRRGWLEEKKKDDLVRFVYFEVIIIRLIIFNSKFVDAYYACKKNFVELEDF